MTTDPWTQESGPDPLNRIANALEELVNIVCDPEFKGVSQVFNIEKFAMSAREPQAVEIDVEAVTLAVANTKAGVAGSAAMTLGRALDEQDQFKKAEMLRTLQKQLEGIFDRAMGQVKEIEQSKKMKKESELRNAQGNPGRSEGQDEESREIGSDVLGEYSVPQAESNDANSGGFSSE